MTDAIAREPSPTRPTPAYSPGGIASAYVFLAGIFLPLLALAVELLAHASDAQLRIDPIPTPLHALWILTVPLACAWASFRPPQGERAHRRLRACIGFALVTAAFYALVYAVATPLAMIAVLAAGLGLLPLAPLLSFGALLVCARATHRPLAPRGFPLALGLAAGLAIVGTAWIPRLATGYAIDAALGDDAARRATGLWVLRNVIPERALLDRCYFEDPAPPFESDFGVTGRGEGARSRARSAYWLATGKSFNAAEAPEPWLALGRTRSLRNERDERAGVEIGGRVAQLSLSGSRLDGLLDPDALTGYLEWTLTFANAGNAPAEARAELLLPPRAVVSRLTLWIDGEEREAAFAGNAQVRGAYQDVVQVKRLDPALVTQCGPDRVRLQCFPVPPNGPMQVRIGITLPLDPLSAERAALELPRIAEHNFDVSDALERAIWLRSTRAFVDTDGGSSATDDGGEPFRWSTAVPELGLSA
ncbi:MAG: hypothetical protein EPO68_00085, partial [Planctomycetota bacterium]